MKKYSDFVIGQEYVINHGLITGIVYTCIAKDDHYAIMTFIEQQSGKKLPLVVGSPYMWADAPKPKQKGEFWLNIYSNGCIGCTYLSKDDADKYVDNSRTKHRVACVRVPWTEGDGL